ncbi:LOW QUALITY PROTEIN: hypothetical protein OSB04_024363 [Centaurea solstitialis]|uniref:RNA-directed DNA polymerase, eukaryota, reverse transcriptase zinc-binding domain protein n=1 Tax=Centaurea solstitialis TaxID=347529 RepID=A0AA38WDS8_9ASTR|nr:LOW QUALITY PROTEIN: hypothetical protein OSB04_024363 [Centaurea solstitialis]
MIQPITKDKVKSIMFDIRDDHAPRADRFTSKFFKSVWLIFGKDVELVVQDLFYKGWLARELNHTSICLIPKSSKCFQGPIQQLIRIEIMRIVKLYNQSAFILGRRIKDNILMAHDLLDMVVRMVFLITSLRLAFRRLMIQLIGEFSPPVGRDGFPSHYVPLDLRSVSQLVSDNRKVVALSCLGNAKAHESRPSGGVG